MVAAASQTLVRRFPGRDGCGTRMQTIPEAFATLTAATRSRICSCSSSSISCGIIIAATLFLRRRQGTCHGCPGASVGNRNSDRRARSTVRDPSRSRPRRQTCIRAHVPERCRRRRAATPILTPAVPAPQGNRGTSPRPPARPLTTETGRDFHAGAATPRGYQDLHAICRQARPPASPCAGHRTLTPLRGHLRPCVLRYFRAVLVELGRSRFRERVTSQNLRTYTARASLLIRHSRIPGVLADDRQAQAWRGICLRSLRATVTLSGVWSKVSY